MLRYVQDLQRACYGRSYEHDMLRLRFATRKPTYEHSCYWLHTQVQIQKKTKGFRITFSLCILRISAQEMRTKFFYIDIKIIVISIYISKVLVFVRTLPASLMK